MSDQPIRTPTMAEALRIAINAWLEDHQGPLPGRIERFDPARGVADVKPLLKPTITLEDGTGAVIEHPVLADVPVWVWGTGAEAGDLRVTMPIRPGTTGVLFFMGGSMDIWKQQGGLVDPKDPRRFHLSDAVFAPGLQPFSSPYQGHEDGVITIGSNGGAAEFVATAQRVLTELDKLKTAVNGHTHLSNGAPPQTGVAGVPVSVSAPASATVKIKG